MAARAGYRAPKPEKGDDVAQTPEKGKAGNKTDFKGWPKDVLRHCFGSYHLAKWNSAGTTAEYMGHRDSKMLYKHYREVIKNAGDIELFWALNPDQLRGDDTKKITRGKFAAA